MAAKKSVQRSGIVVAESAISSIDPDEGVLMYRGYDIADLAEHSTYEETALLLLDGELPSSERLGAFESELAERDLPAATEELIDRSSGEAAPMDMLRTAASSLSFDDPGRGKTDRDSGLRTATPLIARLPTIVANVEHGYDVLVVAQPAHRLRLALHARQTGFIEAFGLDHRHRHIAV